MGAATGRIGPSGVTKLVRPSSIIGLPTMGTAAGVGSSPSSGLNRITPPSKAQPSPMAVESLRNLSPPTYRNSPKFEMEMHDLTSLPPAPAFKNVQRRVSLNYSPSAGMNPANTSSACNYESKK